MPEPLLRSTTLNSPMDELVMAHEEPYAHKALYARDLPWLLRFRIPPFQRPLVWEEARMVRFIESAFLGIHLGTYVVNRHEGANGFGGTDRWLIDGQQRLTALSRYLSDAFPVFGHRWSGLTELDRRRFGSITFAQSRTSIADEATLRELYFRLNHGGVPHAPLATS